MRSQLTRSLADELLRQGYVGGAPPHIPPAIVAADVRSYRRMRCPCGGRGQHVQAFHKDRSYRLVCRCTSCGTQTEA